MDEPEINSSNAESSSRQEPPDSGVSRCCEQANRQTYPGGWESPHVRGAPCKKYLILVIENEHRNSDPNLTRGNEITSDDMKPEELLQVGFLPRWAR